MRELILYIAASLDGYIADREGGVDWLDPYSAMAEKDYEDFISGIDTIIMGRKTYDQITGSLSPDQWVYNDLITYVMSSRKAPSSQLIRFSTTHPAELAAELKKQEGKNIWICGGSAVIHALMQQNLIDRYCISLIPTLLGGGIPLFKEGSPPLPLKLVESKRMGDIVRLEYLRSPESR